MRTLRFGLVLALLAVPAAALAQDKSGDSTGFIKAGSISFGVLGSKVEGDDARFNRFRDLSNGLLIDNFSTAMEKGNWLVDVTANHVAREDARYNARFVRPGVFKGAFQWDEIRELVSDSTKSLFTQVTPGVLRVDDNVQTALQNAAATTPSSLATVLPATLSNFAIPFTLGTRRHIASGNLVSFIDKDTTVSLAVDHTNRYGAILYSGTFGFSNAVDIPQPISQHTTNASLNFERQAGKDVLLRVGFTGSYFRNDNSILTWDNPYRITDSASLSSQGRTLVAPGNNFNVFNGSISFRMPGHSRLLAYTAFGFLDDNGQAMIPQTINTALPVLALSQTTVGGKAHTKNANLNFSSRPNHMLSFDVRYKYYDFNNLTPEYSNGTQRIAYDSALQTSTAAAPLAALNTDRYGGSKQNFAASMNIIVPGGTSVGVGYDRNSAKYEERIFAGSHEDVFHVSYDALQTQYFSVHMKYEHGKRRGTGLDTTDLATDGEQTTLQHFDIADRDRDLFTLAAAVFPVNGVSLTFSAGNGQDKYPNSNFGLVNAKHYVYSAGIDVTPNEHVAFNAGINLDDLKSLQWSRTANPGVQAADPSRDWSTNGHDRNTDYTAGFSLPNLAKKVDLRLAYDYLKGRGAYIYGLGNAPLDPVVATTLTAPVQLPALSNDLTRTTFDVSYHLSAKVDIGFSYWYERFKISDLALDTSALPASNLTTTDILMGYQYEPYKVQSFFGRLMYRW